MRWITRFFALCSLLVVSACNSPPDLLQTTETRSPSPAFEATQVDEAPSATATQAATLVPTPTPYPTFGPTSTLGPLPSTKPGLFTHHLIWLDEQYGRLLRLNKDSGAVEVLAGMDNESIYQTRGRVFAYDTRPDTQKILLWTQVQETLDKNPVIDLALINLVTKEFSVLYSHTSEWAGFSPNDEVQSFALSPNGQWAAFLLRLVSPSDEILLNTLNILAVDGTRIPLEVASCVADREDYYQSTGCILGNVTWSETSRILAWKGYEGMWTYVRGSEPELVLKHKLFPDEQTRNERYSPIAFSHDDKYLMINMSGWEGGVQGIFDTDTGQIAEMPDVTYYSYAPESSALWLSDGRILISRAHHDLDELSPGGILRIYSLDAESEDLLREDLLFEIPPELGNTPYLPIELSQGVFRFGLTNFDAMAENYPLVFRDAYIYEFEEIGQTLTQVHHYQVQGPYSWNWVPDASGLFFNWDAYVGNNQSSSYVSFLAMDRLGPVDMTQLFSRNTCCYTWKK